MMRRILLLGALIALPLFLHAQQRTIEIDWENPESVVNTPAKNKVDLNRNNTNAVSKTKTKKHSSLEVEDRIPVYSERWQDNGYANSTSLRLTNIQYQNLSADERRLIKADLVPNSVSSKIMSSKGRDILYTTLVVSPVVNMNGALKKITSFNISYSYTSHNASSSRMPISNSVLATGNWYKFKVEQTGVHRIDRDFLNNLGMNTDGINPRNLKIYGHGGKTLPFLNIDNTQLDLPETAIQVIGEADGSFDSGDFILFYGISTLGYDEQNDTNINPYSNDSYYYITADGGNGLRVQAMNEPSGNPSEIITTFNDYKFHEEDEDSPAKVGRRWFGNRFDIENEQSYEFEFPNIVPGSLMNVRIKLASASESVTSTAVSINGTSLNPLVFSAINDPTLLDTKEFNDTFPAGGETVTIDLNYNNGSNPSSIGYIDYLSVEALRRLTGTEGQMAFQYNNAIGMIGVGEYQITNAAQFSQVWDVTDPANIRSKQNEGGASQLSFKANLGELRKYVAVNPSDYFVPVAGAQTVVSNQNLKGTIFNDSSGNFQDIDYLIITAPFLIQPALRLATHHKNLNGLNVKVITTDRIYEEFSSGKQDIGAIRNLVRYVYENASSPDKRVKYVCLFGDASIDYKNRIANNNNIVPVYHTLFSNSTFTSYMSDDFYGMMDPLDGGLNQNDILDIAVGRILADEVSLANTLVNKIIDYSSRESYGNWRNNFLLVSDDADSQTDSTLQFNLDALGDQISDEKPFINVKKIHADAFQQQTSAGGNRYPEVNEAVSNAIEVGALVINYFGHGGEDGLAKEFIFTKQEAIELQNKNKYPCIITVTCEFTKFDNPLRITAGELTYWNPNGGAISLITTTRSITVSTGVNYNQELAPEVFGFGTSNIVAPSEALRRAKNLITSSDKRVVFYIGDPAMKLAFAKPEVKLTTLNGVPLTQAVDTLKALSKVRFGGEVVDEAGNLLSGYNGVVEAKIYDKDVQRQTLGNDGTENANGLIIMNFKTLGEILFNGQATVTNGRFEFEFVVPRDIQIPVGNGRASLYSERSNALEDQAGADLTIKVGGLNEDAPEDNQGPLIRLFMNDESFVSGGITNDSPILIAKLEDENGINTASGIGHDIVAILDGDESNPFVLNEYYQAELDDFTKGKATYRLRDLEDGLHTLTLKAWDVYNNSSTMDIQFVVAGNDQLEISRVLNYPNPFVNYTEFWFNHNRPFEPLEVQVQVFTVTGKVVWTQNQIINTDGFLSRDIVWDGKDDFGDRIGKGVYVYKITVKSTLTNQRIEKFEKLVIL
ncbi:type IX secretion system sortase PorU [Constantimarinum furrinae]|uniref:Peptidase C25 n=1 Tax=Constantimarinum furrinae TaxID=2562285 RepID=A0A7G8PUH5_9FLAO|nr:type IX secretion system sortase PorU [Constantimarinum furrinae]QNJ97991.1 peptidase C25 [Constantimarinum furrinae]